MGFQVTGFPSIASWGFILGAQEHSPAFYGSSMSEYLYISNEQFILCLIPAHSYILDNLWYVQLIDSLLNVTPGVFFFGFFFLLLWWFKFCFIVFSFFIFSVVAGGPSGASLVALSLALRTGTWLSFPKALKSSEKQIKLLFNPIKQLHQTSLGLANISK